ncbi:TetR family transcriptional regulator C-terminal domain-containing protein [Streptomyces viridochromogenes]|uniref:TetR family transcriptional regulator C-terminal domain-containing protein n=1 Tax=Streptomyces viridochromogenes TaxID=1938 RepID=UPI001FCC1B17|nr:TetR family transcriptional regulator C-terminal domain-containing protein [Streptomyces viridochromogenes]
MVRVLARGRAGHGRGLRPGTGGPVRGLAPGRSEPSPERGVGDGEFSCDDLDGFTARFAALADGLALQRLRQAPPLTTREARHHLNRFIERELSPRSPA